MSNPTNPIARAITLCEWIAETPHQRGSINGLAAQVRHELSALQPAAAQPPGDAREGFEAFYGPRWGGAYLDWDAPAGRYKWDATQEAWFVWQAASTQASEPSEEEQATQRAAKGWQTIKCPVCGGLAQGFPKAAPARASEPSAAEHPLNLYAENYRTMARMASQEGDAIRSSCYQAVALDIRNNMIPATSAAPARAVEPLTYDEIGRASAHIGVNDAFARWNIARTVIDAFCKKNGITTAPARAVGPLTDEQKQAIHNDTGASHSLICLVESYIREAHGITTPAAKAGKGVDHE